ncbi:MAG: tagaturonate epimerase family protein [Phycisphaeraceae bacterium]
MTPKPMPLGLAPSFGFGDRLGTATPGHLDSLRAQGGAIRGIFAQQSIREMTRTQRTPAQVVSAANDALRDAGFAEPWGADADHLKTQQDVDATSAAGFVFFTIDPSDHVDATADSLSGDDLQRKFDAVKSEIDWLDQYQGKSIKIKGGATLEFDQTVVQRAAVKYGRAITHATSLGSYIALVSAKAGQEFEIELSIDETPHPTTLAEHYIIADQCLKDGMKLVSLAPRFVGDFEKGVDYKGDLATFEESFKGHAAIARQLGPYKLSLHSGSDKLSIYESFARITKGLFHVKTAGTSYLEALRVAARHDPALLREIIDFARQHYDRDKATYHVSAEVARLPAPKTVPNNLELEQVYLGLWSDVSKGKGLSNPGRQVLHCTFGSTLTDPTLGPKLKALIDAHPDTYRKILADHFGRHLAALRAGM